MFAVFFQQDVGEKIDFESMNFTSNIDHNHIHFFCLLG